MNDDETMLHSLDIPPVTKEFANSVAVMFYPRTIDKNSTLEEIMFDAGQRKVVEYIMAQAQISYRDLGYDTNSGKSHRITLREMVVEMKTFLGIGK